MLTIPSISHFYDLAELANYYVAYRRLIDHWQAVMPGVMHVVKYEEQLKPISDILLDAAEKR
jgi:hypothetical protein